MTNFKIGQEVVRTKGDYVVGRVGIIIAIDEAKQRAQVDCGIKTWISFKALAPTSIPYEIVRTPGKNPKYFQKATSSPKRGDRAGGFL
jgi:hypothetical protein